MNAARLQFERAQGRTRLIRQYVPYPFHITRPFYLDALRPDFATIYLQSCSGGLYSGERQRLDIRCGAGAAVEITTQASTLVRDAKGKRMAMQNFLSLGVASLTMFTPDLLVLFPGAAIESKLHVRLEAGARLVCQEGFALSAAGDGGASSGYYGFDFQVSDGSGRLLVTERGEMDLAGLSKPASALGPYRAAGSIYLIGVVLEREAAESLAKGLGCPAGVSLLPNDAGMAIRMLAEDGGGLAAAMQQVRAICFGSAAGFPLAPRRK